MTRVFTFFPGSIAALLYVGTENEPRSSVVFMSKEQGCVVGLRDIPLADTGWPLQVRAQINKHFGTVFALEHEKWTARGRSPRAQYVDTCLPWTIEAEVA